MIEKNEWIPFRELELNDEKFNVFSIDTRDFHCGYRFEEKPHKDILTLKKYPSRFFFTEKEVQELIERYYNESGGECDWRWFSFEKGDNGWDFKYIRIWRTDLGFLICNSYNRAFGRDILYQTVKPTHE